MKFVNIIHFISVCAKTIIIYICMPNVSAGGRPHTYVHTNYVFVAYVRVYLRTYTMYLCTCMYLCVYLLKWEMVMWGAERRLNNLQRKSFERKEKRWKENMKFED